MGLLSFLLKGRNDASVTEANKESPENKNGLLSYDLFQYRYGHTTSSNFIQIIN